jgi:sialic acid synthase SpsE
VLSSTDDAVDAAVSSTPEELASVVRTAARAGSALGSGAKMCATAEAVNVVASRRGLYATRLLRPGHIVADGDVIALRPASDLSPDDCSQLIGVVLTRTVSAGAAFTRADLRADASQGASAKDYRGVA